MFVQAYGAAALIVLVSVVLGRAICAFAGAERWWAAPAVGLAALIIVAAVAIKLPGNAATAAVVIVMIVSVAAGYLLRAGRLRPVWTDVAVIIAPALGASLPFLASGRVGLPGVSLLNDTANHLIWAESLRSARMASLWGLGNGYPLGPHSVVATLGTATGMQLDMAFTGLLISVVPITALVAAGVLERAALWRRVVAALLCSLPYLIAAYYGEGAFKETIMAALLLAFVLHLEQVSQRWSEAPIARRWRLALPAGTLIAGAIYTYSYVGIAWFGLCLTLWIAAETALHPSVALRWISRRRLTAAAPWVVGTIVVAVALLLPVAGQTVTFFRQFGISPSSIGTISAPKANLAGPLSPYETLGVWWSSDFRFVPVNSFHAGELGALALAVLLYGLLWSLRRRQLIMPAALSACLVIWWLSSRTGSPYVAAKALVIPAPLILAVGLRGLLARRKGPLGMRALAVSIAVAFCAVAAYSSYQVLRNEPVEAPEAGQELATFHPVIGDSSVLFLGDDDYSPWQLRPAAVASLSPNTHSLDLAGARPTKPWVYGQALDFDSVLPADLDRFSFVVTSKSPYASQAPANFRLLGGTRLYQLWQRTGPTSARQVLEPSGAPGAVLDCRSRLGRKLRAARGIASVMATPVTAPGPGLLAGASASVAIALPTGVWELSIQYVSSFAVDLSSQGRHWTMPAYLGRLGPFFSVGAVAGEGVGSPVTLAVHARRPSFLTGSGDNLFTGIQAIAATRIPDSRRIVPLSRACGQYVDWYRLS